jgi:superfamily II DNA or RNA helicase
MKPLRPYQQKALAEGRQAYRDGKRSILFVAPTGAGKTRIGAEFVVNATKQGRSVLWLSHRKELILQARESLLGEGIQEVGVIAAPLKHLARPKALVQVASLQTLVARSQLPPGDVVVFDEAHHFVSDDWGEFAEQYKTSTRLGLTATPVRSDDRPLGDLFEHMVVVAGIKDLTRQGFLVPCETIAPPRYLNGDIARDPIEAWKDHGAGQSTVVFCRTVKDSEELAERFRALGISSESVSEGTKQHIRHSALERFKRGELQVLCNVNVLTEGFDAPRASVCILARACGSVGTYLQMVGRVLRPAPGKTKAVLIDLSGVVWKHGLPDDDREYDLDGEGVKKKDKISLEAIRQCKDCGRVYSVKDAENGACPYCGHVAESTVKKPEITGDNLSLITEIAGVTDAAKLEYYVGLRETAALNRYKPGWAFIRFAKKYGMKPPREWDRRIDQVIRETLHV